MNLSSHLRSLESMGLIRLVSAEPEVEYAFRHTLLQEAVENSLLKADRKLLHQAVGEALENVYAGQVESIAPVLAQHFDQAGDAPRALRYYQMAGDAAMRTYAMPEALAMYNQAIQLAQAIGLHPLALFRARGQVNETMGNFEGALADQNTSLEIARAEGDYPAEWQSLLDLGMLWASRDYQETGQYYRQALELARSRQDQVRLAHSLNRVGNWYTNLDEPVKALDYHHEALAIFSQFAHRQGMAETNDLLSMAYGLGSIAELSLEHNNLAYLLFQELDDRKGQVSSLVTRFLAAPVVETDLSHTLCGTLLDTLQYVQQAIELARSIHYRPGEIFGMFIYAEGLEAAGDYQEALTVAHECFRLAHEIHHHQWISAGGVVLGILYATLFEFDRSIAYFEQAYQMGQEIRSLNWIHIAGGLLARTLVWAGDLERAESLLQEVTGDDPRMDSQGWRIAWSARAELAMQRGSVTQALEILEGLSQPLGGGVSNQTALRIRLLKGEALTCAGRWQAAEEQLRAGLELAQQCGARTMAWRMRLALVHLYRAMASDAACKQEQAAFRSIIHELARELQDVDLRCRFVKGATAAQRQPIQRAGSAKGASSEEEGSDGQASHLDRR